MKGSVVFKEVQRYTITFRRLSEEKSSMENSLFKPKTLNRSRLNKHLEAIYEFPLFFISASMGYGKTTAFSQFLEAQPKQRCLWLSLATDEIDDVWVWQKFCQSLCKLNKTLGEHLLGLGLPKNNKELDLMIQIVGEALVETTICVIDDYHEIESNKLDQILQAFAKEQIPHLHIVVISRMRPKADYMLLGLKNKCGFLWQNEIAFTLEEIDALFQLNGLKIEESERKAIFDYTAGWTALIYLVLMDYSEKGYFEGIPQATELIKMIVLEKCTSEGKSILLQLSLLENFTLPQAIYITNNKLTPSLIKNLADNECFIKINHQTGVYTFHALLRAALEEELLQVGIDEKAVLNQCGKWYENNQEYILAIECYQKIRNYNSILKIMNKPYGIQLVNQAPSLILSIFEEMSEEEKYNYPMAYLIFIYSYAIYIDWHKGEELFLKVKRNYQEKGEEVSRRLLGELAVIEGILSFNHYDKMQSFFEEAYEHLEGTVSYIANQHMIFSLGSPSILFLYHRAVGEMKQFVDKMAESLGCYKQLTNGCGTGAKYLVQAEYAYQKGEWDQALLLACKTIHKADTKMQECVSIDALFLKIRIALQRGELNKIDELMEQIIQRAQRYNVEMLKKTVDLIKGYVYSWIGRWEDIPRWIENYEQEVCTGSSTGKIMVYPVRGYLLYHKEQYIELEVLVETMLEIYKSNHFVLGNIEAYLLDALAKWKLYGINEAKVEMQKAIELALPDEVLMPFIERAPLILPILEEIKDSSFIQEILPRCRAYCKILSKEKPREGKEELTEREKEVMNLFCKGYNQTQISETLYISVDTVKKHIKNVYSKLGVHNKAEVIEKLQYKITP